MCKICGKSFIQSGQLVIHVRSHTGKYSLQQPLHKGLLKRPYLKSVLKSSRMNFPFFLRREALPLQVLPQEVHVQQTAQGPHEDSHR